MIIAIAAVGLNNGIGCNNKLLYHIPDDMKFFKETTTGHIVIMGYNTYKSMGCKPLPNRENLVVSKNHIEQDHDNVKFGNFVTFKDYIYNKGKDGKNLYVIGGQSIYDALIDNCDYLLLTSYINHKAIPDTFFPDQVAHGFNKATCIKKGTYDNHLWSIHKWVKD